jgi:hypothetical protein
MVHVADRSFELRRVEALGADLRAAEQRWLSAAATDPSADIDG